MLRLATYNIHNCIGADRQLNVARVASVLRGLRADAIGLQEVELWQLQELTAQTGLTAIAGATRPGIRSEFGNALLTPHEVTAAICTDVSVKQREPRKLLHVELRSAEHTLDCAVVHFGLRFAERLRQVRRLMTELQHVHSPLLAVLGDFNEWHSRAGTLALLHAALGRAPAVRSFPARLPLFALDRIWIRPHHALRSVQAYRKPPAAIASDHLPVLAEVDLLHDGPAAGRR